MKEKLEGLIQNIAMAQSQAMQRANNEAQNVQKLQGALEAYQNALNLCEEEKQPENAPDTDA